MATDRRHLDDLLTPVLDGGGAGHAVTIYSLRACFFVGWLGGAPALLVFAFLNSRRLGRVARDAWFYALFGVATIAMIWTLASLTFDDALPEAFAALGEGTRSIGYLNRIAAMVILGGLYLHHRPYFRASALSAEDHPSPWLPGLGATLIGIVLMFGVIMAAAAYHGVEGPL